MVRLAIVAVSGLLVVLFLITALHRLHYRFELEELEGNVYMACLRAFRGQPVYVAPSMAWIPYMYPPLFYYASAALGHVMGMSIATVRALSILSTLGCFVLIYTLVWTELRRHLPAVAAVGIYAGCYTLSEQWFDMARLDSFFIMLVLLAMLVTRKGHPVLAALVWVLAFQTKQSILPAALVMLCCHLPNWRRVVAGVGTLLVGAMGSVLWLNHVTHGWYSFYVFRVPGANADIILRSLVLMWPLQLLRPLGLVVVMMAAAVLWVRPSLRSPAVRFYLASASIVPLFWWIFAHAGSTHNALMPIYALFSIGFGLALGKLLQSAGTLPVRFAAPVTALLLVAAFVAECAGMFNPGDVLARTNNAASMGAVIASIHNTPGNVWVAQHAYYAILADKQPWADVVALHDALRVPGATRAPLQRELRTALTNSAFDAVVVENTDTSHTISSLIGNDSSWEQNYTKERDLVTDDTRSRPHLIRFRAGTTSTVR